MTGNLASAHEGCGSSQGRGAVFIGEDALPAETEYEKVRAEYRDKDASGIPMSVRERYEKALAELRAKLRGERYALPLGQILLDTGAIDQEVLAKALGEQLAEGGRTLVGEVLVRHGWAAQNLVWKAVEKQAMEPLSTRRAV